MVGGFDGGVLFSQMSDGETVQLEDARSDKIFFIQFC